MKRWLAYVWERFPPIVYLALAGGYVSSGFAASRGRPTPLPFVLAFVGVILFFFELRLMDELKDFVKDSSAHPGRPLPRGLLGVAEVRWVILALAIAMLVHAGVIAALSNVVAGALYLGILGYLLLMYKEFFASGWLGTRPFLYAATHQPVGVLVALFTVAVFTPDDVLTPIPLGWSLLAFGGMFGYEICRKLDPAAPPELGYYVQRYGQVKTAAALLSCLAVETAGSALAETLWFVVPAEALLSAGFLMILLLPRAYKLVEGLASLNVLMALWATFLAHVVMHH